MNNGALITTLPLIPSRAKICLKNGDYQGRGKFHQDAIFSTDRTLLRSYQTIAPTILSLLWSLNTTNH